MGKKSTTKRNRPAAKPAQQQARPQGVAAAPVQQRASILSGSASGPVRPFPKHKAVVLDQGEYVRSDIMRIGLLLVAVAVALAVCSLAVSKSPRFRQAGQHLATALRLQ